MSHIYEKVKGQLALLEKIETIIPGYRGYKEKELRRESDKIIRDYLFRVMTEAKNNFDESLISVVEAERTELFNTLNRIAAIMDRVAEKIHHASYGYSGFFDAIKIRENELDSLIKFDYTLIENINMLLQKCKELKTLADSRDFEAYKKKLDEIKRMLDELSAAILSRENLIRGV